MTTITHLCGHKRRVALHSVGAAQKSAELFDLSTRDCPACSDELAPRRAAKATDPRTRSLELAEARGETSCSHRAHTLGWTLSDAGALVSLALAIDSAHDLETRYAVGYSAATDDATCDCTAAQYGRPCWHRGLAILCGRAVTESYSTRGRASTRRAQYLACLEEPLTPVL